MGNLPISQWNPRTYEDKLLFKYWTQIGGLIFAEVPIGNRHRNEFWPEGSKVRRIDGIRIINSIKNEIINFGENTSGFVDSILGKPIEIIEIKRKLNRPVIGQVIAGTEMFKKDYQSGKINRIVLCNEGDPALEWVCKQWDIEAKIIRMNDATNDQ